MVTKPVEFEIVPVETPTLEEMLLKGIAALRSGRYEKCRVVLKSGDRFCALGTILDANFPDGWVSHGPEKPNRVRSVFRYDGSALPEEHRLSEVLLDELGCSLADLIVEWNDDCDLSFPIIADRIENQILPFVRD